MADKAERFVVITRKIGSMHRLTSIASSRPEAVMHIERRLGEVKFQSERDLIRQFLEGRDLPFGLEVFVGPNGVSGVAQIMLVTEDNR